MGRSCRLTCLKTEGNQLLKYGVKENLVLISAYHPAHGWT